VKDPNPVQTQVNSYIRNTFGRKLSDAQILEIQTSLFYLGRAVARHKQVKGKK